MFGEMLALGRTKSPAQTTEYAEIIWRESVRLARLIDNVLDFAKIERGVDAYEFTDGDVGDVVTRAIELSQHRLAKAEMTALADLEPDLPAVRLDPNAFTLAVLNLIDNGIKYAAVGQEARGRAAPRRRPGGAGDPRLGPRASTPEEHGHIFERFYRARAVRLKPIRGSGIGLALVEHIVAAHGGGVTVSSEPGAGATFTLWLPVPPPPKREGTSTRGRTALVTADPREGQRKILVIEDEPDLVRGLTDALEFEGFEVQSRGHRRRGHDGGDGVGARTWSCST